jgi:hypothetical protein
MSLLYSIELKKNNGVAVFTDSRLINRGTKLYTNLLLILTLITVNITKIFTDNLG